MFRPDLSGRTCLAQQLWPSADAAAGVVFHHDDGCHDARMAVDVSLVAVTDDRHDLVPGAFDRGTHRPRATVGPRSVYRTLHRFGFLCHDLFPVRLSHRSDAEIHDHGESPIAFG